MTTDENCQIGQLSKRLFWEKKKKMRTKDSGAKFTFFCHEILPGLYNWLLRPQLRFALFWLSQTYPARHRTDHISIIFVTTKNRTETLGLQTTSALIQIINASDDRHQYVRYSIHWTSIGYNNQEPNMVPYSWYETPSSVLHAHPHRSTVPLYLENSYHMPIPWWHIKV